MGGKGKGRLTLPTSVNDTVNVEVNHTESLLLASMAAVELLEQGAAGAPMSTHSVYGRRREQLREQIAGLAMGVGDVRDSATYSIGW